MDELADTAVNNFDNKRLLRNRESSNMVEMQEMIIPSDVNIEEKSTGLYLDAKNAARIDTSDHAFTSPNFADDSTTMVEELTVRNYNTGNLENLETGGSNNSWQQFHPRVEGSITDPGSNFFPELINNKQQIDTVDQSTPGGIRTKMLSQSGFSQFFVKNTLKGKGVVCNGPARGQHHPPTKHDLVNFSTVPDSSKDVNDGLISLREWLKTGQNKVDKSKTLYIFKQILDLVDSSHSRGEPLQALRPSCFKLTPSNQVIYQKEFNYLENGDKKRELEKDIVLDAKSSKRRKNGGNNVNFVKMWPQFAMRSGFKDSGYGFNEENIPKKDNSYPNQSMPHIAMSNFRGDPLEEQWYASPEDPSWRCSTLSSNVYSLGVLLFELLGSFESARAHAIAMMDLRQRILPPSYLLENPQEAGFCLWLLHPEPSLRPTTREILQSQLVSGIQQSSITELSSSIEQQEAESDLMLHFLANLKEQKQKGAKKLVDEIKCLESDISQIYSRQPNKSLNLKSSTSGSPLINNLNHLEHAYFSVRSSISNNDTDEHEEHEVLKIRENYHVEKNTEVKKKPLDRVGVFFNGLCKYARYNKFEVKGTLRNGDFSNIGNVVCSLGFDRDEDYFATAGVSKKIKVYDFHALLDDSVDIHYPAVEMSNKSKLSCICWNSYIRNYLASTDYDGVVKIWDAGTGEAISHHIEHERRAWSVDFSRVDPIKLASGSDDCSVKLWSINEKKSLATIKSVANVCCVQFSPYSSHLLSFGSADYRTYCYDLRNVSTPLCTLAGHDRAVSYVKFLDCGTLVSASTDNTLKLWDLNKADFGCLSTTSCITTFKGHTNEKNFVGLSVSDGYIACGSETNEVYAYYRSLPMPITSHKFGSIDPISGKETENESNQFVSSVCWRQKSDMVVAANSTGSLKLLQMV